MSESKPSEMTLDGSPGPPAEEVALPGPAAAAAATEADVATPMFAATTAAAAITDAEETTASAMAVAGAAPGARLIWEKPGADPTTFALGEGPLTLGRDEADLLVTEPLVSRQHARLERRGDCWWVVDLGSTNLTRLNGEVVKEAALQHGDELRFARARCLFQIS